MPVKVVVPGTRLVTIVDKDNPTHTLDVSGLQAGEQRTVDFH
jgi:hypothetical protein